VDLKKTECKAVEWINLAEDMVHYRAVVNTVNIFEIRKKRKIFLNNLGTVSFSKKSRDM
jgi:hypothetical protein